MSSKSIIQRMRAHDCCSKSHVLTRIWRVAVSFSLKKGHPIITEMNLIVVSLYTCMFSESISIESNIASAFNLRTYSDVVMQTVLPVIVALDSVEITFKDQYLGRSEMWRLKSHLVIITTTTKSVHFVSHSKVNCAICFFSVLFPDEYMCLPRQEDRVYASINSMSDLWALVAGRSSG